MKQLLFIITLLFSFNTIAQDGYKDILDYEVPEGTVSLCKEKHSSGYNWENGKWIEANYDTKEYIIKKIAYTDIDKVEGKTFDCKKIDDEINDFRFGEKLHRCYSVKEFGEELRTFNYKMCEEWYFKNEIKSVSCDGMGGKFITFIPNGLFVKKNIYEDVSSNPHKDYKDSMVLSHGLCATIN